MKKMIINLSNAVFQILKCTKCGRTTGNSKPNQTNCPKGGYCDFR